MRPIIAFTGLIGSGKTTAAMYLVEEHNFRRIRFAGPLKDMMRALGLSEREIEGDLKEKPCDLLGGKTPRYAMQTIGTEWGRQIIASDIWTNAWHRALSVVPPGIGVVADDCRFPNELAAVRAASPHCLVARIVRPGLQGGGHISELQAFPADIEIQNAGSVDDLLKAIDGLVLGVPA